MFHKNSNIIKHFVFNLIVLLNVKHVCNIKRHGVILYLKKHIIILNFHWQ
jgi:hypothetical protein